MATIPSFAQFSWGDTLTFQLPIPTSLGVTAAIVAVKPRSGARATWTGVVSDAADTVSYTFTGDADGPWDLDEWGRWLCEIVLSDGRVISQQSDGVTPLMFDVLRSTRSAA